MGGCPPPHATRSRVDSRAPPHAVRAIARGAWAPARRVDAPLRCGVPQGPHHLVRWCGGVVRRGVSVGAEQARARTPFASPAGDSAIRRPRRSGCARLCALRARTARIRLRDGRGCWWRVSTQSASPHRSPVGRGRGRGCRITRLGRHTERVLSSCTLGRGVLAEGGMSGRIPHGRSRAGGGLGAVLGARRGVGGDARRPWPCHWHARITQGRRVGELEPKTVFFEQGVKKTSGHVVGLSKVSGWIL